LPETEACVQHPGTVRGAEGSRLKQKPVSYDYQASLACVLGAVEVRERDWRTPFGFEIETTRLGSTLNKTRSTVGVISLKLAGSSSCRGVRVRIRLFLNYLLLSMEHGLLLFKNWCVGW
jgi:hypothetical protein